MTRSSRVVGTACGSPASRSDRRRGSRAAVVRCGTPRSSSVASHGNCGCRTCGACSRWPSCPVSSAAKGSWVGDDAIAQSLQQTLRGLDVAYRRYLAGLSDRPRFKSKRHGDSFRLPQGRDLPVRKLNRRWAEVRIPKLGWCRFRLSRPVAGEVRHAIVSRDALGWHVSFCVTLEQKPRSQTKVRRSASTAGSPRRSRCQPASCSTAPTFAPGRPNGCGGCGARPGIRRPPAGTVPTVSAGALHATSARWIRSPGFAAARPGSAMTFCTSSRPSWPPATA